MNATSNSGATCYSNRLFGVPLTLHCYATRKRAPTIRRKFYFPSYAVLPFFCGTTAILQSFRCAPAEQGSCCTSTLPRAVSPAQVLLSVVCGSSVILRDKRRSCRYSALIEYAYVKIIVIVHLSGCKSFYFLPVGFTVFVVNADCKKSRFYGSLNRHQHIFKYYCFACF